MRGKYEAGSRSKNLARLKQGAWKCRVIRAVWQMLGFKRKSIVALIGNAFAAKLAAIEAVTSVKLNGWLSAHDAHVDAADVIVNHANEGEFFCPMGKYQAMIVASWATH